MSGVDVNVTFLLLTTRSRILLEDLSPKEGPTGITTGCPVEYGTGVIFTHFAQQLPFPERHDDDDHSFLLNLKESEIAIVYVERHFTHLFFTLTVAMTTLQ